MTLLTKQRPRNVLTQVHSVKHDGGRFIKLLNDFTFTNKVLYTGLLACDFGRFVIRGSPTNRVHRLTEYTETRKIGTLSAPEQ